MIDAKSHGINKHTTIDCPSCGEGIDVEQVLGRQAEARLRSEYNSKFLSLKQKMEEQKNALERERMEVKQLSAKTWDIIQEELKKERIRLAVELKKEAEQAAKAELGAVQTALVEQEKENMALRRREVEILNREKQLSNDQEKLRLKLEREFLIRQSEAEKDFKSQFYSQQDMIKQEYEKKLSDQRRLIEEMNRKIEQGSMQMQGEVQEMAIEQFLNESFPVDHHEPIKTGARGADCVQVVMNRSGERCGTIYYESKRTKSFQPAWIEKFKIDMRSHKADVGVLVTQAMPKDMERMGQVEGIWICTFEEFKALSAVLRQGLLQVHAAKRHQEQRGDKAQVLYNYLISNEFKMQIEGIVEGFTQLHEELNREKRAMESIWKRREKQIDKVLLNTNHMYSSIRGLAGSDIQNINVLELGGE